MSIARSSPGLRRILLAAAAAALLAGAPAAAQEPRSATSVPGQVVVRYQADTSATAERALEARLQAHVVRELPGGAKVLDVPDGRVDAGVAQLRADPQVASAAANHIARASGFIPNDRGYRLQWNLWGPFGIRMPEAWSLAAASAGSGGRGVTVAVLDTGVAYRTAGAYRRAPDLRSFVPGYDFVSNDPYPFDLNGHGTHVAGTIAGATNNRTGVAGIASGARIMPVRTLGVNGGGDAVAIASGVRFAVTHGADVINMSLEFAASVTAKDVPDLMSALAFAHEQGVVVTAVAGNHARVGQLPFPGRAQSVIAVAATTSNGCRARYSNAGPDVDVAAPGGGSDAQPGANAWDRRHCRPGAPGLSVYQQTFSGHVNHFTLPDGYMGTSMAAPHVAGVAALLIASGRLGADPAPEAVQQRIEATARDLGTPGFDPRYGHGLIDAAAALR